GSREAEAHYWIGAAHAVLGDRAKARAHWEKAAAGGAARTGAPSATASAQSFYRAMALEKLGRGQEAEAIYRELVHEGSRTLEQGSREIDFFASFGEQQSQRSRIAAAHYLKGLGHLGLGETQRAREELRQALRFMPDHLGARAELAQLTR
ncbi:MAG: tetratricopeptide repeat protein, partial [Bryobacteraceae bacterium]